MPRAERQGAGNEGGAGANRHSTLSLDRIGERALDCHTPRQFRRLLEDLRVCLPYRHLFCWTGEPANYTIQKVVEIEYPRAMIQWYLGTGMIRRDPLFHEWLRRRCAVQWVDVVRHAPAGVSREYAAKMEKYGLTSTIFGGQMGSGRAVVFSLAMRSEEDGEAHRDTLDRILPDLCLAFTVSQKAKALTGRQLEIMKLTALGESHKRIADQLSIAERTVRMHLEQARRALYADNITQAVVIAIRAGMLE